MGSKKLMGQIWRICSKVRRTCEEIAKVNDFSNTKDATTLQQDQMGHAFT